MNNSFLFDYRNACITPSDINQHLVTLFGFGKEVNHITEMGVRTGVSTRAWLNLAVNYDKTLIAYDLYLDNNVADLFAKAKKLKKNVTYNIANTLNVEIEPTDLLFIDTQHTYHQLISELKLHGNKASKYIIMHDTVTFPDLNIAIEEFLQDNKHWILKIKFQHNNGLTILERTNG